MSEPQFTLEDMVALETRISELKSEVARLREADATATKAIDTLTAMHATAARSAEQWHDKYAAERAAHEATKAEVVKALGELNLARIRSQAHHNRAEAAEARVAEPERMWRDAEVGWSREQTAHSKTQAALDQARGLLMAWTTGRARATVVLKTETWLRAHPATPTPDEEPRCNECGMQLARVAGDPRETWTCVRCDDQQATPAAARGLMRALSRAGLALVPAADVQPISDETLRHLRECALAWEPEARVIGDVTAHQLRAFCLELAQLRSAAEAARLVAGSHDNGECSATLNDELSFRLDVLDGDEDALTELARRAAKEAKGG